MTSHARTGTTRLAAPPDQVSDLDSSQVGPWQLVRRIGHGQWSEVFQVRPSHCHFDQPADYALKRPNPQTTSGEHWLGLLRREDQVGRQVSHRHLAPVLASSVASPPYWLVFPYLEGHTLEAYLVSQRRLPPARCLWIARQVAEALASLHKAGWMHGDVKPHNVVVSPAGHATLVDLGFARPTTGPDTTSSSDTLTATPAYAAPETFLHEAAFSAASDTYSLGIVLFECLTGRRPFPANNVVVLADAHLRRPPPDVRQFVPDLRPALADLVWQMLAKQPQARPSDQRLLDQLVSLEIDTFELESGFGLRAG